MERPTPSGSSGVGVGPFLVCRWWRQSSLVPPPLIREFVVPRGTLLVRQNVNANPLRDHAVRTALEHLCIRFT
jgi:hypothetical protein